MYKANKQSLPVRREAFRTAWRELAMDTSFAGMSLADFEERTREVVDTRERIGRLRAQLAGALRERGQADEALRQTLQLVVNAVRGAPGYGEDSPLYRSLGYVPKSERASGLTRKGTLPPETDAA